MQCRHPAPTGGVLCALPRVFKPLPAHVNRPAFRRGGPHQIRNRLAQNAETLFTRSQCPFGKLLLRHILQHAHRETNFSGTVEHRRRAAVCNPKFAGAATVDVYFNSGNGTSPGSNHERPLLEHQFLSFGIR